MNPDLHDTTVRPAMPCMIDIARTRKSSSLIENVAEEEGISTEILRDRIATGKAVIMQREDRAVGIGEGLRTKVNVNLGSSTNRTALVDELKKARIAQDFGADTLSDLSMGGDISGIRSEILCHTTLPITTVPIYQVAAEIGIDQMTSKDLISVIRQQAREGVSSMVLHCVNWKMLNSLKRSRRIMGFVSKGGSITSVYMSINNCDNPFIENFPIILKILKKSDIVLSLGNTARSGCVHDLRDPAQTEELRQNLELARYAHANGVQTIIEGAGGHIRADMIRRYIRFYKRKSPFPLFVSGPLPTDIAFGYDHIAGCVGASIASAAGADYLCAITPAEHLGLPSPEDVKEGLIAFRIAAHIGDIQKFGSLARDRMISTMRSSLDIEGQIDLALDQERARSLSSRTSVCTMCGDFCALKLMKRLQ